MPDLSSARSRLRQLAFIGKGAVYDWLNGYANHDLWGKTRIRNWAKGRSKEEKKSKNK